jgi:hypothetical protein
MVQQQLQQQRPDRESDENEPITDLPIIDSPCKSCCQPIYELCMYYMNKNNIFFLSSIFTKLLYLFLLCFEKNFF